MHSSLQAMNSSNYNSEKQIEKQMKKEMEERNASIVADQVNLFVIGFLGFFFY